MATKHSRNAAEEATSLSHDALGSRNDYGKLVLLVVPL